MADRILIVDDVELNLKMVSTILAKEGYEVVNAQSGGEALEIGGASPPSLAILDVMLPDFDGFTLYKRINSTSLISHIPIIIHTALTGVEDKLKAFDSGADDFLPKPFDAQELRVRIRALLR